MNKIKKLLCAILVLVLSLSGTAFAYAERSRMDELKFLKSAIEIIDSVPATEINQFVQDNSVWINEVGTRLDAYLASISTKDRQNTLTQIMGGVPSTRGGNNLNDYFNYTLYYLRSGYHTYSLDPKWSVRLYRPTMEAAWSELENAYVGIQNDNGSLWNQYLCHWDYDALGILAGTWDLEVERPVIPYSQMLAVLCNP